MSESVDQSKRRFLTMGVVGGVLFAASPALALPRASGMKELAFRNLHTDEKLRVTFWRDGRFDPQALSKINHLLRDYRTGDVYPIASNLIDLLHALQGRLRTDREIEVISGYRSPKTNAMLTSHSRGVAKKSLHMEGRAIDVRMAGISLRRIQTEALLLKRGGVGYYPGDFVHVDVGRVRRWG